GLATKLKSDRIAFLGPTAGARQRPDGKTLQWKTLNLQDDAHGLLPFFIQWSAGSVHPSLDAPQGCQLLRLELDTPTPAPLAILAAKLGLNAIIVKNPTPQLRATISGPKGQLSLAS